LGLEDTYIEFAEALSEHISLEFEIHSKSRLVTELKKQLTSDDNDGSYATEFTGHAFKAIAERLEELAAENPKIHNYIFKDPLNPLLMPSNLKSFIISLLADARKKGDYKKEQSKNTKDGCEFRYNINISGWGTENKKLYLVVIVEDNHVKTGFFNWAN